MSSCVCHCVTFRWLGLHFADFAATGHAGSAASIAKGLTEGSRSKKPAYWIQISGASLFAAEEIAQGRFGEPSSASYDDVEDISKILSIIKDNPKREVEQTVLAQSPSEVRTALLPAPLIYGVGRGPCQRRSIQAPEMVRVTLELGHGIRLLAGKSAWSTIHISDLGELVRLLVQAAVKDADVGWNSEGIYNAENGKMQFGELGSLITAEARSQGLIKSADTEIIDAKRADELSGHASVLWGTNAVVRASRAQASLSWKPVAPSLKDEIPDLVRSEAALLKTNRSRED